MRIILLLLIAAACASLGFLATGGAKAEDVTEDWIVTHSQGGLGGAATDPEGNTYVLAGRTIFKHDQSGTEVWARTFDPCGGPCGRNDAKAIAVSPSGDYVWAAGAYGSSYNGADWFTVGYDANGAFQWIRSYAGAGNDHDNPSALAVDSSENVYVTGTVHSGSNRDAATLKYDLSGNLVWARTFDGGSHDDGEDIGVDSDGRVYVLAMSIGRAEDFLLLIYSPGGVQICNHRYDYGNPGPNNVNDIPEAIAVLPTGGAFVTGRSYGSSFDYATLKYNAGCGVDWIRRFDSGVDDDAREATLDSAGGVYISGDSGLSSSSPPGKGIVTLRYDGNGNLLWDRRYDGPGGNDSPTDIAAHESGVYVAGESPGDGTGTDWVILAYSPTAELRWTKRYSSVGEAEDLARAVTLDAGGGIYVAGTTATLGSPTALVKYATDTDADSVPDYRDNCPNIANPGQEDSDGDGQGDACDVCTSDPNNDADNDGICVGSGYLPPKTGANDNCPATANPTQTDTDSDGAGDACDNCPNTANPGQENHDGDKWGDACDYCPATATPWYTPAGDDDCDGFTTSEEGYVGTDPLDACPDNVDDDAWPPDVNGSMGCGQHDGQVDILDVLCYKPKLTGPYDRRYDLDASGEVNVLDILLYKLFVGTSCTNP
jgi:hypothetical protein